MDNRAIMARVEELEQQIDALPVGSVSSKSVNGKEYYYRRWYENKKRKEKYLPAEEVDVVRKLIAQRKKLEAELKTLRRSLPKPAPKAAVTSDYVTNVRAGLSLRSFSAATKNQKKRECYQALHDFVYGNVPDKVFILYGLRKTGKTAMIRQLLAGMSDNDLMRAAFIQTTDKNTLADMKRDLKVLEAAGYRYIFIDEVTLMKDFIDGAAPFPMYLPPAA